MLREEGDEDNEGERGCASCCGAFMAGPGGVAICLMSNALSQA
jgi:hypothetical protein